MKVTVVMPQLGESVAEGEVTAWLKREGDAVERDEAIVEVKTDKATVEVPSPASGVLSEITAKEGETVAVGAAIAQIETAAEHAATLIEHPPTRARQIIETRRTEPEPEAKTTPPPAKPGIAPLGPRKGEAAHVKTTPLAHRLIEERGLDAAAIHGSGAGGRITREDVLAAMEGKQPPKATEKEAQTQAPAPAAAETKALSPMRRRIAARMMKSHQTIPQVTTAIEVDMTGVNTLRMKHKDAFEKKGVKLTCLPFIMKAAVAALEKFPDVNSSWADDKLIMHKNVHLGIAVAVEGGLAAPVIRNANGLSVAELAARVMQIAEHARTGKLNADEVQGGTFTITNPGLFGAVFSTPIINPPEAAILGVCRVAEMPVVRNGEVTVRWMMNLCLSYDHRIMDGEQALRFLQEIRGILEKANFEI